MLRDLSKLTDYLATRLPGGERITGIRQLATGFSNETYLVEGADLILRAPPIDAPLLEPFEVHGVVSQFEILAEYDRRPAAPPTPRPVHIERDPTIVGFEFFVMERVESESWEDWEAPDWVVSGDDVLRASISEELIATYAKLHGLAPFRSCGDVRTNRRQLEIWHEPVRETGPPALKEAFALLSASVPDDAPPSIVHGDAKIANILWRDGRIVAMLDYEMSFNGDPRWDLGSLLRQARSGVSFSRDGKVLTGFWDCPRLVEAWHRRTQRSIAAMDWFEAASNASYAAILAYGHWLFDSGRARDERYGSFGPVADRLSAAALELARLCVGR